MKLGLFTDPTLEAVDAAQVAAQDTAPRSYLGASSAGDPCSRKLWYRFRWAMTVRFDADTLRRFEDGFAGEAVIADRLRLVKGIRLVTVDPATGEQYGFIHCGGHVRGHMDGAILGLLQARKTWHVWECKITDEKKAKKLADLIEEKGEKDALEAWDEVYYAQAQLYMHWTGMERHYLVCGTAGSRKMYACRTEYDEAKAKAIEARAFGIVSADEPPPRLSEDPAWYQCKWCEFFPICHEGKVAEVNCRTCLHSTPVQEGEAGAWRCERHAMDIERKTQLTGCGDHLFIPQLVPFAKPVDADDDHVVYELKDKRQFKNGPHGPGSFESKELAAVESPEALVDPACEEARQRFSARHVKRTAA